MQCGVLLISNHPTLVSSLLILTVLVLGNLPVLNMPKDGLFSFSVYVGGQPLAEHVEDGNIFIEADIFGESAKQETRFEIVDGEEERQLFSVLPYIIIIHLFSSSMTAWAFVSVDGFHVAKILMFPGNFKTVEGFRDGDNIREFLFSMPRFGSDKDDKIEETRRSSVGVIEVVIKAAVFMRTEQLRTDRHIPKGRSLVYNQATKKDSHSITNGEYLMATTKPGIFLPHLQKRKQAPGKWFNRDLFGIGNVLGHLKVKYHMKVTCNQTDIIVLSDTEDE